MGRRLRLWLQLASAKAKRQLLQLAPGCAPNVGKRLDGIQPGPIRILWVNEARLTPQWVAHQVAQTLAGQLILLWKYLLETDARLLLNHAPPVAHEPSRRRLLKE